MKNTSKLVISIIGIVAVLMSLITMYDRIKVEETRKNYDVCVKYTDVLNISRKTGKAYDEVLAELKQIGVNMLLVEESTIAADSADNFCNLKSQGKANYYSGYEILDRVGEQEEERNLIKPAYQYIWCLEDSVRERVYAYYTKGGYTINEISIGDRIYLEMPYTLSTLVEVGIGFDEAAMKVAADMGYVISPQIDSIKVENDEAVKYIVEQVKQIPSLGPIFFKDNDLVNYKNDEMYALIDQYGIGFVEFFSNKQKGFTSLTEEASRQSNEYKLYRLHTLNDGELDQYEGDNLYDRFDLALTERGISYFLFKLPKKYDDAQNYEKLKTSIIEFNEIAAERGYAQGDLSPLNFKTPNTLVTIASGIAAICVFLLICFEFNITRLAYIASIIGVVMYSVLVVKRPILGSQLMGLFISVCFPIYAMLKGLNFKAGSLIETIKGLAVMFIISVMGGIVLVAAMGRTEFALGIELFKGVKIAFVMPILIVPFYLIYKEGYLNYKKIMKLAQSPINYLVVAVAGCLGVVAIIYISRSGNSGTVTDLERQIRQLLRDILGTRPRTKEFLISYPIIVALLYYGKHKMYMPLAALATVGPVSVVNTFSHIHTPVIISIKRTFCGLGLGLVLGLIVIGAIQILIKIGRKYIKVNLQSEGIQR